jgi:hypothetical protein
MKKLLTNKIPMVIVCLFLSSVLFLPIPAFATWIHGNSGHLQKEGATTAPAPYVYGWGIDFVPGSNTVYWVHYALPLASIPYTARYIHLKFFTGIDSSVTQVMVYDANLVIATLTVPSGTGWQEITLDMGSSKSFSRGLGISIKAVGGPDAGIGRFMFAAVGASNSPSLPAIPLLLLDE